MIIRLIIVFSLCLGIAGLGLGFAQTVQAKNNLSLGQAVKRVKQQQNGRVLSATTRHDKQQRSIHNIRILTPHGKVKRYQINERNGQFIRPRKR